MGSKLGILKIAAKRLGLSLKEYEHKISAGLKWCHGCRVWKPQEQFGVDASRGDGLSAKCFSCKRVKIRKSLKGRTPWNKGIPFSEESKEKMSQAHKGEKNHRWKGGVTPIKEIDPLKKVARRVVNHAIESGKLSSPKLLPCFDCGEKAREYDHYRGYERQNWLDIQAVCSQCHHTRENSR